jgi:DNA-binding CsgD family transcriptional regulator
MDDDLIDRIYECAFVPEHWVRLLDEVTALTGARGGMLYSVDAWDFGDDRRFNWPCSDKVRSMMLNAPSTKFLGESGILRDLFASQHQGFLREIDVCDPGALADDPLYRDVLIPAGLGKSARIFVKAPTGDNLVLSWQREYGKDPFEDSLIAQLDLLRPHLARTMLTSARLQLERARATTDALEMLGLPALVFNDAGKVIAANSLIEALSGLIHWRARDRMAFTNLAVDALFKQASEAIDHNGATTPRSFVVRNDQGVSSMVGHVIPIRRDARDILAMCSGVLMLTPLTRAKAPPVELVQSLFDLTPAEARVARSLTTGKSIEQIAVESGVALATVRTQVRGVLEKTGCHRQAEVVSLFGGLTAPELFQTAGDLDS